MDRNNGTGGSTAPFLGNGASYEGENGCFSEALRTPFLYLIIRRKRLDLHTSKIYYVINSLTDEELGLGRITWIYLDLQLKNVGIMDASVF